METNNNPNNSDEPSNRSAITIDVSKVNGNTKAYIDAACQNIANMIITSIKALLDQHATIQSAAIDKVNKHIDQCVDQLQTQRPQQQSLDMHENPSASQYNHDFDATAP
ncbi:41712_t:CDS:1, partial [Gigaspora margarita]